MTHWTLTIVASADGFIARHPADGPWTWASAEEQSLFFRDVEMADWAVMGRATHETADKPDRRRIIFSSGGDGWRRETQLWVIPAGLTAADLPDLVDTVHPLRRGLILGGTRVHDWFLSQNAVDQVNLTVEPVRFGTGLTILPEQTLTNPVQVFTTLGFQIRESDTLNAGGTKYVVLERR